MSDTPEATQEEIELAVCLAMGNAVGLLSGEDAKEAQDSFAILWPEYISADALNIASQAVLALCLSCEIPIAALMATAEALTPTEGQ